MRIAAPEPTPAAVDAAAMEKAFDASSAFAAQQTLQAMQDAVGYASASNVVLQRIAARAGVPADQAAMLAARLGASAAWIADRQRVIARAQLAAPAPIADAWTLHGFVIDGQNRAVAGARVQLVDGVTPVPGGGAAVDGDGHFVIVLPASAPHARLAAPPAGGAAAPSATLAAQVLDAKGNVIARPGDRFVPEPNVVDELDVVVSAPAAP